ncbi:MULTISPECIES: cytochrome P450 [Halomonadaceae]|uniref:cytochrome P450 n=1 Tax=Halomonadaceae TaxID=28256 RepID=UPI0015980E61|nr:MULTISPECIES: cytochrome P450 [Halomonas]QJQ94674.1 cytochrome P450 [Halomonas sp. PA5]
MFKTASHGSLPKATLAETTAIFNEVLIPTLAKGAIIRRPAVVGMAARMGLDRRAVRRLQKLHDKYGAGPLLLRTPIRSMAIVLDPDDVQRILEETPEPFATAEYAKRSALRHFEPKVALISHGSEREERRRFNEKALDNGCPIHHMADSLLPVVEEETSALLGQVQRNGGELDWDMFIVAWYRVVRRVVLGDSARDDHELTEMLAALRSDGNWGFLKPKRTQLSEQFLERLRQHLDRAEPGSLAAAMANISKNDKTEPANQVPQWLFAFDPAGMATFRALALFASHHDFAKQARTEIGELKENPHSELRSLRAAVLESLRLWPTTPMILRENTEPTEWQAGEMPANTSILIFAPYFHRDDRRLSYANRFASELWEDAQGPEQWPLMPFSGGPGICPGRHLVLMLTSHMLARLVEGHEVRQPPPAPLHESQPMPALLDNYSLRFWFDELSANTSD